MVPATGEEAQPSGPASTLRILFVSESGVCRAPLAAAAMTAALRAAGLADEALCAASCSRDYNAGDGADPFAVAAAEHLGLLADLPSGYTVRVFDERVDIVQNDLVLVFDKYTAADVLREISVFDTIDPGARLSSRVRRLGEFRSTTSTAPDAADIDDPLYGNFGGAKEAAQVTACADDITDCCSGLVEHLMCLRTAAGGAGQLRAAVAGWLCDADGVEWLVPPMLQPRR